MYVAYFPKWYLFSQARNPVAAIVLSLTYFSYPISHRNQKADFQRMSFTHPSDPLSIAMHINMSLVLLQQILCSLVAIDTKSVLGFLDSLHCLTALSPWRCLSLCLACSPSITLTNNLKFLSKALKNPQQIELLLSMLPMSFVYVFFIEMPDFTIIVHFTVIVHLANHPSVSMDIWNGGYALSFLSSACQAQQNVCDWHNVLQIFQI